MSRLYVRRYEPVQTNGRIERVISPLLKNQEKAVELICLKLRIFVWLKAANYVESLGGAAAAAAAGGA